MELLKTERSFRKEFKRQLRYAISAAIGFLIAFSWRETVISYARKIVEEYTTRETLLSPTYTSLLITLIGVLVIILSSKMLKEK